MPLSFGLATIIYAASIPGKGFTGYVMEIIGRRWTIFYALAGSLPGLVLMLMAHRAGANATIVMMAGGLITGFTVLSAFTATRVYLSEQFTTALRGRGHIFGESAGRVFAGVLAPFLMAPYTGSPSTFFGTIRSSCRSALSSRCFSVGRPLVSWKRSPKRFRNWPDAKGRLRGSQTRKRNAATIL